MEEVATAPCLGGKSRRATPIAVASRCSVARTERYVRSRRARDRSAGCFARFASRPGRALWPADFSIDSPRPWSLPRSWTRSLQRLAASSLSAVAIALAVRRMGFSRLWLDRAAAHQQRLTYRACHTLPGLTVFEPFSCPSGCTDDSLAVNQKRQPSARHRRVRASSCSGFPSAHRFRRGNQSPAWKPGRAQQTDRSAGMGCGL